MHNMQLLSPGVSQLNQITTVADETRSNDSDRNKVHKWGTVLKFNVMSSHVHQLPSLLSDAPPYVPPQVLSSMNHVSKRFSNFLCRNVTYFIFNKERV